MLPNPEKQNPAGGRGFVEQQTNGRGLQAQIATVDTLLQRLDRVQRSGNGWRARCPACEGTSRKLSVAESDNRVLLHCFAGCRADDVLAAVGLCWADLMPPRTWPTSPEEQRRARRAMREAGWAAALDVLSLESTVLHLAAMQLDRDGRLPPQDGDRLALACDRIDRAARALTDRDTWRPDACYSPARLVAIKRGAFIELTRQVAEAEHALTTAEAALKEHDRKEAPRAA